MIPLSVLSEGRPEGCASSFSFVSVRNANPETDRQPNGNNSTRVCDPLAIRRKHPEHWMAFLRAHFRDPVHVRFAFSVDDKTARNWWEGKFSPQGWAVEFALKSIPNAASWLRAA